MGKYLKVLIIDTLLLFLPLYQIYMEGDPTRLQHVTLDSKQHLPKHLVVLLYSRVGKTPMELFDIGRLPNYQDLNKTRALVAMFCD